MGMSKKMKISHDLSPSLLEAQAHYNHELADKFYKHVWAGDDIYIGLGWQDEETQTASIAKACQQMVNQMRALLPNHQSGLRVLDLGAGYGATARHLVRQYGFRVDCLNLSEIQNLENQRLNQEQALTDHIQVFQGNFESLEFPDGVYQAIWSQDAFLHSDNRPAILHEVHRVLQEGGDIVFTDILQAETCPADALQAVLARFGLKSLATQSFYCRQAQELGWQVRTIQDISPHLVKHYQRVTRELDSNFEKLQQIFDPAYLAKVRQGMANWINTGEAGYLKWGMFHFNKSIA